MDRPTPDHLAEPGTAAEFGTSFEPGTAAEFGDSSEPGSTANPGQVRPGSRRHQTRWDGHGKTVLNVTSVE